MVVSAAVLHQVSAGIDQTALWQQLREALGHDDGVLLLDRAARDLAATDAVSALPWLPRARWWVLAGEGAMDCDAAGRVLPVVDDAGWIDLLGRYQGVVCW